MPEYQPMPRRLILLLVVTGLAAAPSVGLKQTKYDDDLGFDVAILAGWTKVNPEPYYISSHVDLLCVAPKAANYETERKRNPHASTFITVFVNSAGKFAMFANPSQPFPEGSVIVKQKYDHSSHNGTPILSTVMIKREPGYNPAAGDWEFAVVSGDGKSVEARGKLGNCLNCHASRRDQDFVFRSYLPPAFK
jgi:hypothetical protein